MKLHIGPNTVIATLLAALLLSAAACSDRNAQARLTIAAADSLMMTDPQAALDTLLTIDSADAARLPRADRALYTLLRTEAEYKCWLPVAGNTTAMSKAVDYYRRNGPEDRLARALTMQGAVLSEQGDTDGAMLAYKEAEPLLERSGDLEQLGLLHTRIGELYQTTLFSNTAETVYRYRKALECFEAGNYEHRLAAANLTLSRILLAVDSAEQWKRYHGQGRKYAVISRDTVNILESINQYALFCLIYDRDSLSAARLAARTLLDKGYCRYLDLPIFNSFCQIAAEGYTGSEKTDSSIIFADMMTLDNIVDSMCYYHIYSEIMEANGHLDEAVDYERKAYAVESRLNNESDILDLNAFEQEIQNSYDKALYKRNAITLVLIATVLASVTAIMTAGYFRIRKSLKQTRRKITDNLHAIYGTESRKDCETSEDEELERLFTAIRKKLAKERKARKDMADITSSLLSVTNEMLKSYYRYKDANTFQRSIDRLVTEHLSPETMPVKVIRTVNAAYPGFLDRLRASYPRLTDNDTFIIALISCGFDNESMCLLAGVKPESMMVYKSRIAAKMGIEERLTRHISSILSSYSPENTQSFT